MAKYIVNDRFIVLFLFNVVRWSEGANPRNSLNDDLLLPYPPLQAHGPTHHHRFVRDCQPVQHGNVTFETWRSAKTKGLSAAETNTFVSHFFTGAGNDKWVSGHLTFISDPLRMLSVLEPGGPGGCQQERTATVEETANSQKCLVAQNGGYFNTKTGQCLGNVVSNGNVVRNSKGIQNAQFGIKKDGTLVFGYLSEDDVLNEESPFVQLVSGVVWLLRNGEVYINESKIAECEKTQETGTFDTFINVVSARTAVGHDKNGRLVLFHIDGQTNTRGMNLWEVASFLKDRGVINAINLDGGGSATFVVNGTLASYPSDHCLYDNMWRCPRSVSTVLCVHEPWCNPVDCSGHGQCVHGECQCIGHWMGSACDTLDCQPSACGPNGVCTTYGCVCDAGWLGSNCSQVCPAGFYGDGCNQTCSCQNGASCDPVSGSCICRAGFHGDCCEQDCPLGFYGLGCKEECQCKNMCPCDTVTGSCNVTYQGEQNYTLHRAGHCLASHMFESWRDDFTAQKPQEYLSQMTWIMITTILGLLLLISTVGNLTQICGKSPPSGFNKFSYLPLNEGNGKLDYAEINTEPTSSDWSFRRLQEQHDSEDST
nr:PREDICTED: N-acetylglucosamine-1-phosphodiester alpha-N-acetylglucosaminidase [Lepisosteus oculatus]